MARTKPQRTPAKAPVKPKPEEFTSKLVTQHLQPLTRTQDLLLQALRDEASPIVIALGAAGSGKAMPLDTKVLVPNGWASLGELSVGDTILDSSSQLQTILGYYPQGVTDCYRITFADGRQVDCSSDHLWEVFDGSSTRNKTPQVLPLKTILAKPRLARVGVRLFEHQMPTRELPVDPYILGCLLGDGYFGPSSTSLSSADSELVERFRSTGYELTRSKTNPCDYGLKGEKALLLRNYLRKSGLAGTRSDTKFIPEEYLLGSLDQRWALLQGLMDTDGTAGTDGSLSFQVSNKLLAEQVQRLIWSLGGICKLASRKVHYTYKGAKYEGKTGYRLSIRFNNPTGDTLSRSVFRLTRKRERTKNYQYKNLLCLRFKKIERVADVETACIRVSSSDRLFVVDNYVLTHNTWCAVNSAVNLLSTNRTMKNLVLGRAAVPTGRSIGLLPGPQPLWAKVLTPTGWTTIGQLKVGDLVLGRDGQAQVVEAVFEKGEREVYSITDTLGGTSYSCLDHPWFTTTFKERKRGKPGQVRSLREIKSSLTTKSFDNPRTPNHILPSLATLQFSQQSIPLDPYLLGCLLGDGWVGKSVGYSTADDVLRKEVSTRLAPLGLQLVHQKDYHYAVTQVQPKRKPVGPNQRGRVTHPLKVIYKQLGLFGKKAWEKFVPTSYIFNTEEVRLAVLRGLMDTDGTVKSRNGEATFYTASLQLAEGVVSLVNSLGGSTRVTQRLREPRKMSSDRSKVTTFRTSYAVTINICENPFFLPRKADLYRSGRKRHSRRISAVEYYSTEATRCIRVSGIEHLYITDDFVVTHNTAEEKLAPWLAPMLSELKKRVGVGTVDSWLHSGKLELLPLETIRGRSFDDTVVLIDECQSLQVDEVKSIVTRVGQNCKLVLTGDLTQSDIRSPGLLYLLKIMQRDSLPIPFILFETEDIVRSDIVGQIVRSFHKDTEDVYKDYRPYALR